VTEPLGKLLLVRNASAFIAGLAIVVLAGGVLPTRSAWADAAQPPATVAAPTLRSATITGDWSGWYYYPDDRSSVAFTFRLKGVGEHCTGTSEEGATFGDAQAKVLTAALECDAAVIAPGQRVVVLKRYNGGGVSHTVRYVGIVSDDLHRIDGEWHIGTSWGPFSIGR